MTNPKDIIGLLHKLKALKDECTKVLDKAYSDDIGDAINDIASTLGIAVSENIIINIFS